MKAEEMYQVTASQTEQNIKLVRTAATKPIIGYKFLIRF